MCTSTLHIVHDGLRVQLVVWECNCQLQIPVSCLPFSSIFTGIELLEARLDNLGDALPNPGVNRRMELVNHQLPEKGWCNYFVVSPTTIISKTNLTWQPDQKSTVDQAKPSHKYNFSTPKMGDWAFKTFPGGNLGENKKHWHSPHCNGHHVATWSALSLDIK